MFSILHHNEESFAMCPNAFGTSETSEEGGVGVTIGTSTLAEKENIFLLETSKRRGFGCH